MNLQAELANIKKTVDRELERFFVRAVKNVAAADPVAAEAMEYLRILALSGGKRLRPALFLNAYEAGNGKDRQAALKIAVALELVHIYLLIHDDIIDHGALRHGQMTAHLRYAQRAKKFFGARNEHFGVSLAIVMGDMLYAMAIQTVLESGLPAEKNQQIAAMFQKVVVQTVVGQVQDICIENRKKVDEEAVLAMYRNKTAQYTFQGPLRMGQMLLENGDVKLVKALDEYALNLGLAFQIRDDIIGIFGNKRKTGKEVGIDIVEGKKTLMVIRSLELASGTQKKRIGQLLGKKDISWKGVKEFQQLMIETGALEYAQNLVGTYSQKAQRCLQAVNMPSKQKDFLLAIAGHLVEREA